MTKIAIAVGAVGVACIAGGTFLAAGLPIALIVVGVLLLAGFVDLLRG